MICPKCEGDGTVDVLYSQTNIQVYPNDKAADLAGDIACTEVCPVCLGSGDVEACPECHGSGKEADSMETCCACGGSGFLPQFKCW